MARPYSALCAVACLFIFYNLVYSYEISTHADITAKAFELFQKEAVGNVAFNNFAFKGNSLENVTGSTVPIHLTGTEYTRTALLWFTNGSKDEDRGQLVPFPTGRFIHHFFNPLTDQGLSGNFQWPPKPSRSWAIADPDNLMDEQDADGYYAAALSTTDSPTRTRLFAKRYYSIGAIMHLTQDLASPQHVRDENHGLWSVLEQFADHPDRRAEIRNRNITGLNSIQRSNLSEFWKSSGNGLAEFANREFLTPKTMSDTATELFPDPRFPHPAFSDINEPPDSFMMLLAVPVPGTNASAFYISSRHLSLGGRPVLLGHVSRWNSAMSGPPNNASLVYKIDDNIAADNFRVLLLEQEAGGAAGAIRNSAGVLHHFFPGWTIDATAVLAGDTLKVSGTIQHNREPGTFQWNDAISNGTSRVTLLGQGIAAPITKPFAVTSSAFDASITLAGLGLPPAARIETAVITIDIGVERHSETIAVTAETKSITIDFGFWRNKGMILLGVAYEDTDSIRLPRQFHPRGRGVGGKKRRNSSATAGFLLTGILLV